LIVLVHSGITDARMWDGFDLPGDVRRLELSGFGETPMPVTGEFAHADELEAVLAGDSAALVGASYGGKVCLEVAARSPELVTDLVLMGAPLPDHDWSDEIRAYWAEEDRRFEQGDFRGAATLGADFWLEDTAAWDAVVAMQERIYELGAESDAEEVGPERIDLGAITARTLVIVGEHDKPDFHAIAKRLTEEIRDTESAVIPGSGHLPAVERQEETLEVVRAFLAGSPSG